MQNRLLDALPRRVYRKLEPQLERVSLTRGEVLHSPGEPIRDLYFPLNGIISITITMGEGRTAETGIIGNRDVVGVNAFMGECETTQTEYIVQIAGDAVRVAADPLLKAFDENKSVRDVLLKYTQAIIAQISQNAACNRLHDLDQRLARWLLEMRDRVGSDDLHVTQEFMSQMLGVRRATVTEAALELEKSGVIDSKRGMIRLLDVGRLERTACECYRVLIDEYDRLLGVRD